MKIIMAVGIALTLSTGSAYAYDSHKSNESAWQSFWSSLFGGSHGGTGMCS